VYKVSQKERKITWLKTRSVGRWRVCIIQWIFEGC
jgi:hypothetical protein